MVQEQISQQDSFTNSIDRLRTIEGKYNLLRDRMLLINNNMIDQYKKSIVETRTINEDIRDIKSDIFKIKETMKHLLEELELFARKEEVKVLEKYINIWNPIKFVTEDQLNIALGKKQIQKEEHKKVGKKEHGR